MFVVDLDRREWLHEEARARAGTAMDNARDLAARFGFEH